MRPPTLALSFVLVLVPAFSPAFAAAQAPAAGTAASAPSPDAAASNRSVDEGQLADPNIDRGVLFPTAQTQPAGTFTVTDYQILIPGITYAITDRLQVGLTVALAAGVYPVPSLKWQFLRQGPFRLSLLLAGTYSESDHDVQALGPNGRTTVSLGTTRALTPIGGLVGSVCLDAGCHSMLSANALVTDTFLDHRDRQPVLLYAASLSARLSTHFKVVLEYANGRDIDSRAEGGIGLASAVLRASSRRYALEAGVMAFVSTQYAFVLPLPFLSGSVRLGGR